MTKLGNQLEKPTINGLAYKFKPIRHSRLPLSGDSDTSPLTISTTGTLIHTATDYAFDEVFLWASNHNTANDVTLTVEIGGDGTFSDPNLTFIIDIPKKIGLTQIYPGVPHQGINIYAKASSSNKVNIFGYVDRHYRLDLRDESLGYDGGDSGGI